MYKLIAAVAAVLVTTIGITPALATNHNLPNGKAFVELQGQIAEVKNDISDLEAAHLELSARVDALDADLQGQIDALDAEVVQLQADGEVMVAQITAIADQATQNGYDAAFALSEINRLQGEIDALEDSVGDNSDAIADLEAEMAAVQAEVAANASGLLGAFADIQANADLIGLVEDDIAELQDELANAQLDIGTNCPPGYFVFGVQDDGSLECAEDSGGAGGAGGTEPVATTHLIVYSGGNTSLNNSTFEHCIVVSEMDVCTTYNIAGDKLMQAQCPAGFKISGGGFITSLYDDIGVEWSFQAPGERWSVKFDNRATGVTTGRSGQAIASCIAID